MQVAIRVDASLQIGTGHVMRCLTLAHMLRKRHVYCRFICRSHPGNLIEFILKSGFEVEVLPVELDEDASKRSARIPCYADWLGVDLMNDAQQTIASFGSTIFDWLIVDHYALDARWECAVRPGYRHLLVIDDLADRPHDCDVLLDQNFYTNMGTRYLDKVPAHCKLLLGPRYTLLRDEFQQLRGQIQPRTGPVKRVFVFFGGVDIGNYTLCAIKALTRVGRHDLHVDVVIGVQHPARAKIEAACARHGYFCHVQTTNMAELMAQADLAVGAGGTATWERCCLGLPTLTLCVADNQRRLVEDSALFGLIYAPVMEDNVSAVINRHFQALLENPGLRTLISRNGMDTVDGRGASRVLRNMDNNSVKMRLASNKDSTDLLSWRNHPSIRVVSRNNEPITVDNHERWLNRVLLDKNRDLLIGYCDEQPIGVVRFDIEENLAEVSIYIVPGSGEQGLGTALLASAEQWLSSNRPDIKCIRAEILGNNEPSHRLFMVNGYVKDSTRYLKRLH